MLIHREASGPHIRFPGLDLCQICRRAAFAQNGGRAKAQNMGAKTTSFFAGRPERGNYGLCPTCHGAEVDVHRPQGGRGRASSRRERRFSLLAQMDPRISNSDFPRRETFSKPFPPISPPRVRPSYNLTLTPVYFQDFIERASRDLGRPAQPHPPDTQLARNYGASS